MQIPSGVGDNCVFPTNLSTEYGLIHVQTCPRYILDATYEQDKHYLSHTDGRLHVPPGHGMASFGPDGYCVEFVAFEDRISVRYRTSTWAPALSNVLRHTIIPLAGDVRVLRAV